MIGESVGAYTIVSELGRGGMGVVYLAQHRHLRWRVAIKFLLREFTEKPDLLHRFFTEARAASVIDHEGIVRVLDCDVHASGHAYIVMEYLEGHTLRHYLAVRGRLPYPEAAAIIVRVAEPLSAAHAQGIVHRDVKPDNIFLLAGASVVGYSFYKSSKKHRRKLRDDCPATNTQQSARPVLSTTFALHRISPAHRPRRTPRSLGSLASLALSEICLLTVWLPFALGTYGVTVLLYRTVQPRWSFAHAPNAASKLVCVSLAAVGTQYPRYQ